MATTSWFAPGTVTTVNGALTSTSFTNPNNVKVFSDNTVANANSVNSGNQTQNLQCHNFGITTSDVPYGATINGIEVEVRRAGNISGMADRFVILFTTVPAAGEPAKGSGGRISDNLAAAGSWPTSQASATYGGASDLWGASISDADVRSTTFGFSFSGAPTTTVSANVDGVRLRVHYTASGAPTVTTGGNAGSTGVPGISYPSGADGDYIYVFVASANQTLTDVHVYSTDTFSVVYSFNVLGQQGTGTAGGTTAVRLGIFGCPYDSSQTGNLIRAADSGDHTIFCIMVVSGVSTSDPHEALTFDVAASASTSVTVPGGTTLGSDRLCIMAVANATDTATAQGGTATNADLTSITNVINYNNTSGNGSGISVYKGIKASAGSVGSTTLTLATSSVQARAFFALKPLTAGGTVTFYMSRVIF